MKSKQALKPYMLRLLRNGQTIYIKKGRERERERERESSLPPPHALLDQIWMGGSKVLHVISLFHYFLLFYSAWNISSTLLANSELKKKKEDQDRVDKNILMEIVSLVSILVFFSFRCLYVFFFLFLGLFYGCCWLPQLITTQFWPWYVWLACNNSFPKIHCQLRTEISSKN